MTRDVARWLIVNEPPATPDARRARRSPPAAGAL